MSLEREFRTVDDSTSEHLRELLASGQLAVEALLAEQLEQQPEVILTVLLDLEKQAYDQLMSSPNVTLIEALVNYATVRSLASRFGVVEFLPKRDFTLLHQPQVTSETNEDEIQYDDYRGVIKQRLAEITHWVVAQFESRKIISNAEFEQALCNAFPEINPAEAHNAALYIVNTHKLMNRTRSGKSYIPSEEML